MSFTLPPYTPPDFADDYGKELLRYNREIHARLRKSLEQLLAQVPTDSTIAVLGSDGRFEKNPASKIELCVYHRGENIEPTISALSNFIKAAGEQSFLQEIDIKDATQPGVNYYQNDSQRTFPTRITDSSAVYGSLEPLIQTKRALVLEWAGPEGRHIFDKVSGKAREARKIIDKNGEGTYRGTPVRHFDIENGTSTYDPTKFHLSFKAGPLRFVQYSLSRLLIKYARKGQDECERAQDIVQNMPANTHERLVFLSSAGVLGITLSDAVRLGDAYDFFNELYHVSETNYLSGKTCAEIKNTPATKDKMKELTILVDSLG